MRPSSRTIVYCGVAAISLGAALVAACSSKPAQEKAVAAAAPESTHYTPPPGMKPAIGDFGLDLTAGKPQVKPGEAF